MPGTPNVDVRYALDEAAWLWHPRCRSDEAAFLLFRLDFEAADDAPRVLQVSADLRFELALDGVMVASGPDSGDVAHWSFSTLTLRPGRGSHRLEALVWWMPAKEKLGGRMSWRGGFACAGADRAKEDFHTGFAPWRVAVLEGWFFDPPLDWTYHVIGPALRVDLKRFDPAMAEWTVPASVRAPVNGNEFGLKAPGWSLLPSGLPAQRHDLWRGGFVRHAVARWQEDDARVQAVDHDPRLAERWRGLWHGEAPLTLGAGEAATVLLDFDDYLTGYPVIEFSGGAGAELVWEWAEALYEEQHLHKGHRDVVEGKLFEGWGDRFTLGGEGRRWIRAHWWRAGRYLRLRVRTAGAPLTLHALAVAQTGLPFAPTMTFESDDDTLAPVLTLCLRGLRCSMHETYVDTPHYEQMMYAADTRLEMLMTYVASGDDRLARRGMDLLGMSRDASGLTAMRYPSAERQESATFAMFWIWMLHDYLWWRDDRAWLARHLPGMRGVLDALHGFESADGLLDRPPGWLFVDWVPAWDTGWAPGSRTGVSALVNLQHLLTLQKAAELEENLGESALARRLRDRAARVEAAVRAAFWNEQRGLFADDPAHRHWSQHAQIFALLAGMVPADPDAAWADPARMPADMATATVYFCHYLFEACGRMGRTDLLLAKLDDWRTLTARGLKAPVEGPEPSRSDCHAWGSHPLYHLPVTIAGIRPDAPGFHRVRIAPRPGPLQRIDCVLPHPAGFVRLHGEFAGEKARVRCELPAGVGGVFAWAGREVELRPGAQIFEVQHAAHTLTNAADLPAAPFRSDTR